MLNANRLRDLLPNFPIVLESRTEKRVVLTRESKLPHLYERLEVTGQGKAGEAAYALIGVSAVLGINATKGLIDTEPLLDLAENKERGWTVLRTKDEAIAWEKKLANAAPSKVQDFVQRAGPQLLEKTKDAREAVARYLGLLPHHPQDIGSLQALLLSKATPTIVEQSRRLADWPGVLQQAHWESYYFTSALCINLYAKDVEQPSRTFQGADPLREQGLMMRIQLLVDRFRITLLG